MTQIFTLRRYSLILQASSGCFLIFAGCAGNAPGKQDDVVVRAPGTEVKADDQGVAVKAPLGIEVNVGVNGVAVKAPGVDVKANPDGVSVDAPLGVRVRTGQASDQAAKAP